jgi:uncharacterized membrane protein YdfJ with MMPL/SSD domain
VANGQDIDPAQSITVTSAALPGTSVFVAAGTLAFLLVLALPFFQLNLGFNGAKGLPDAVEAKKALLALQENFTLGLTSPAMVVVDAGKDNNVYASDIQGRVNRFVAAVQSESTISDRRQVLSRRISTTA